MAVRAKIRCFEKKDTGYGVVLQFVGVYSTDPNHENKAFWDASPSLNFSMTVKNGAASAQFEQDKEYYIDFTPADPAPQVA